MKIIFNGQPFQADQEMNAFHVAKALDIKEKIIAIKIDGQLFDATTPLTSGNVETITATAEEALTILNHSCAHLMAAAIKELYPTAQFGVGPAIEEGFYYDIYMEQLLKEEDLDTISKKMLQLAKADTPITRQELSKEEALKVFAKDQFKTELIQEIEGTISTYSQVGFTDLCRGPHVPKTGVMKHFKLLNLAGSYWRGDSKRETMQRIYGICFFSATDLDNHLALLEERKQRDHRRLGKELKLFMFNPLQGQGLATFLPRGMVIVQELQRYILEKEREYDFAHVATPIMGSIALYQTSGHWEHYRENMFPPIELENDTLVLRPMSCPHHILVYKNDLHSYNDLPLRLAEQVVQHRFEASGALTGLERVRAMTLTDSHIFCTPSQIKREFSHALKLILEVLDTLKINVSYYRLSLHDPKDEEKYFRDPQLWEHAEATLRAALKENNIDYIEAIGEAAFYGPKLDIQITTALGHDITMSTLQLDFVLPERFDLTYVAEGGEKKRPVMIHRGLIGTYERFMAILIEQTKGVFPLWLAPSQVTVLPVIEKFNDYALSLTKRLKAEQIRAELDARNEKLGYRLRQAQVNKVPFSIVIGEEEITKNLVTYRRYGSNEQITIPTDEFISLIKAEIKDKL